MGTGFYPASGSLEEIINTLHAAFYCFHMGVVQSTCIYNEIVLMNIRLSTD